MYVIVEITNKGYVGQYELYEVDRYRSLLLRMFNDGWQIMQKIRTENAGELAIVFKKALIKK